MYPFLDKTYDAKQWEPKIYRLWETSNYFNPDKLPAPRRGSWSCIMPPPNATGVLHAGHVVMAAYQDALTRFWRLRGKKTLWLPGTDHAAIATQTTVEKKILKEQGKTRHHLGRAEFLRQVETFVQDSQNTIHQQLRATGVSCDWSREAFTLDEPRQLAVRAAFKKMYDDGLIYRGERVVNWCPHCQSTIADDEVVYQENVPGKLYTIQYGPLQIATTRPETKLGDTGVAVHPSDERYQKFIGKTFDIKLAGHAIKVKVFADHGVDKKFGTGAIGVTPAHSAIDAKFAQRHKLTIIKVINEAGLMTKAAGSYAGLTINDARQKFINDLRTAGQLIKTEDITHALGTCYRCNTPIEPLPKEQWFVAVDKKPLRGQLTLKQLVTRAVKDKRIIINPDRFTKDYLRWAHNLHDWCISRQIWYGHRLPVYYYPNGEILVTDNVPSKIIWTRHGATVMTEQHIIQGQNKKTNTLLSKAGKNEADQLAQQLKDENINLILYSPLKRAKETADIIAKELKIKTLVEPLLIERYYGEADGKKISEAEKNWPDYATHRRTAILPKAETAKQLQQRVTKLFAKLIKKYPGQTIVCVTHNGLLRTAIHLLTGKEMEAVSERVSPAKICLDCNGLILKPSRQSGLWQLQQDADTLDTWFSSALWTFSTLGWPRKTKDLTAFHPTDWMETAYDILNLWVSRMVMMSEYFLHEVPFKNVYLHGIVRDEQGRKLSKSLGNGIDPLVVIDKYGADALRLALTAGTTPGGDMKLGDEKIAGFRNFINKLWNISRFILLNNPNAKPLFTEPKAKSAADAWILAKMNQTINIVAKNLETYRFSQAIETLHNFTWSELADWYLEISKIEKRPDILNYILTQTLILWHPFCPFVTETIWQFFKQPNKKTDLLIVQKWPRSKSVADKKSNEFDLIKQIILSIRSLKIKLNLPSFAAITVTISGTNKKSHELIELYKKHVHKITGQPINPLVGGLKNTKVESIVKTQQLGARLWATVKLSPEQRAKQITELKQYITSLKTRLADSNFTAKAPTPIIEQQKQKLYEVEEKLKLLS